MPRVGISRCLLGDAVRYDGCDKLEASLIQFLSPIVEWVPVCPEVEVGMGVPREPIHLAGDAHGRVRLIGVETANDWTDRVQRWAEARIDELRGLKLAGFVLKARSPSCGVRDVPIEGGDAGRGMFADLLLRAMPDLPVEDEERLRDPDVRGEFVARVRSHRRQE